MEMPYEKGRLYWAQPGKAERTFELLRGQEVTACWRWEDGRGARVTAWCPEGTWMFWGESDDGSRIVVRVENYEEPPSVFEGERGGRGVLVCADGRFFHWESCRESTLEWAFNRKGGKEKGLVSFQLEERGTGEDPLCSSGLVRVEPAALKYPELPLLILLGWYLVVQSGTGELDGALVPAKASVMRA